MSLFSIVGISCGGEISFKEFTNTEGISNYRFEYPSRFYPDESENSGLDVDLLVHFYSHSIGRDPDIANMFVSADRLFDGAPTVKSAIGKYVSYFRRLYPDLDIISQESIAVAGVKGEKLINIHTAPTSKSTDPDIVTLVVFFQRDDIHYEVSVYDIRKNAETLEEEFSHVIQTFEFLE